MGQMLDSEKSLLQFNSNFCIFVALFAFVGITFVVILQRSGEESVVIFAPILNYFHPAVKSKHGDGAFSGEDSESKVLPEVGRPRDDDPEGQGVDPPLGIVPQHENETNFPVSNSQAAQLVNSVRILCCVTTSKKTKQNAMAVKQTWGNRCNKIIFISDEPDDELGSISLPDTEQGSEFSWGRSKVTLEYIWTQYGKDFDWFLKADDMTYVIVENLRHFLSAYQSSKPGFFGCNFDTFIHSAAGFVMSKEALRQFVEIGLENKDICSPSCIGNEDVELMKCLKNLNVELGDSRDEFGRHRMLPYSPERHLIPEKLRKTYWFWQNLYSPHFEGMECCSDRAISFHHIQPYQMIVFHYFVFHLRPYGVSLPGSTEVSKAEVESKVPPVTVDTIEHEQPKQPTEKTSEKAEQEPKVEKQDIKEAADDDVCDLRTIPRHLCHCPNLSPPRSVKGMANSTCSNEATTAGPHQKVVSYSLSGNGQNFTEKNFLPLKNNIEASLMEMESLYPDWVARIYTDISLTPSHPACDLICKHSQTLFWCDVNRLPELGDKSKMASRTWRLLPLGDPTVDTFISRDLERSLSKRERTAVAEWEAMHYPYHAMRDHPEQYTALTGDSFGVRNDVLTQMGPDISKWMQTTLVEVSEKEGKEYANGDDALLNKYVYEPQKHLVLAHDSYSSVEKFQDGLQLPFPVKRDEGGTFVGQGRGTNLGDTKECPLHRRPSYGKEWKYC